MTLEVYAMRYNPTPDQARLGIIGNLAVLGYPVTWTLHPAHNAKKVTLSVADGAKVWEDNNGRVWIDEGNGAGVLRTFDEKPTLTISTYYGDNNKSLRIMAIK